MSNFSDYWAKDVEKAMSRPLLTTTPTHPPTRWQKFRRALTRRSVGKWLTYKLMEHYDIYEQE